ncbi:type VI secretion system-associated protein TagO [Salinisphaera sp. C84B14]|uniref:type VI secretion system-associated protein TagO n=1 Tax=Salinisphaera sp. C84B14 TaxID=1304155 RepID=UPI00333E24A8
MSTIVWSAFLALAIPAFAEPTKDIAACAAESADAERLICYDNLAKSLGVDAPKQTVENSEGDWRVHTETSPIDDSTNVYLTVAATEAVPGRFGQTRPTLWVRCLRNTTEVIVSWQLYLGLDETQMLTRLDKEKAETRTWSISTNNQSVFYRGNDIQFTKKLFQHKKLLVQITPYGENPVMTTFNIGGLEESIKPLRKACHW